MNGYEWMRCIRDCPADGVPPGVRALLMVMATYADQDGRCYPGLEAMMAALGVDRATVKRRRAVAVKLGRLVVEHTGRYRGDRTRYRLIPVGCLHARGKGRGGASLRDEGRGAGAHPFDSETRPGLRDASGAGKGRIRGPKGVRQRPPNVQERSRNGARPSSRSPYGGARGSAPRDEQLRAELLALSTPQIYRRLRSMLPVHYTEAERQVVRSFLGPALRQAPYSDEERHKLAARWKLSLQAVS